jgi:hypothetical protein
VSDELRDKATRSWASIKDDDSTMHCYLGMSGRVTVASLIAHFKEHYPHVDPMGLRLNVATIVWEEPPTEDDLAKRDKWRAEKAERTERWERDTYERLKAKYA